jgi:hypothetical protein
VSQPNSHQQDSELQQRVCRACNVSYPYPVRHSLASRFYCEDCMELPSSVRDAFERMNKRIKTLSAQVQKLEKQLAQHKDFQVSNSTGGRPLAPPTA